MAVGFNTPTSLYISNNAMVHIEFNITDKGIAKLRAFAQTHQVQHMDVVVGKDAYYLLSHAGNGDLQRATPKRARGLAAESQWGHVLCTVWGCVSSVERHDRKLK